MNKMISRKVQHKRPRSKPCKESKKECISVERFTQRVNLTKHIRNHEQDAENSIDGLWESSSIADESCISDVGSISRYGSQDNGNCSYPKTEKVVQIENSNDLCDMFEYEYELFVTLKSFGMVPRNFQDIVEQQ